MSGENDRINEEACERGAAQLAAWRCPHCDAVAISQRAAGGRAVLEVWHEPGCPDHVDPNTFEKTFGCE